MPFAVALLASALFHVAALLSPGWVLPGVEDTEESPPIEAVLAASETRAGSVPPAVRVAKPAASKPRRLPSTGPVSDPAVSPAAPVAVPPASTFEPPPEAAQPVPPLPAAAEVSAPVAVRISLPGKGRIRYSLTKGEGGFVIGQTVQEWEHDGQTYTLRAVTKTTGLAAVFKPARVIQVSTGDITAEGLRPREFRHERLKGIDTVTMDWSRGTLAYAGRVEVLPAGTQDMLSMYYQLVMNPVWTDTIELPIATGRKLNRYRFQVIGEETLHLPAGDRNTVKVRARSGEDILELWISPRMAGLPLKIRFIDRHGEIFDQIAEEIDLQDTP